MYAIIDLTRDPTRPNPRMDPIRVYLWTVNASTPARQAGS